MAALYKENVVIDGIRTSLDALKRQALFSIISNIDIAFPYIKEDIINYINKGGSFTPLMESYSFDPSIVSSSQVNAEYVLSYLDFYALYSILYANQGVFESLRSASINKLEGLNAMYKDMYGLIRAKELEKSYSSVLHIDFMNPAHIDLKNSGMVTRFNKMVPALSYKDVLTLPISTSRHIKPQSIMCYDNDGSIHVTANNTTTESIDYSIKRKQTNKLGVIYKISTNSKVVKYAIQPNITGTVYGYYSERVYITYTNDGINHLISGSTNNKDWSTPKVFALNEPVDITIEDDITIGLSALLYDGEGLASGDSWIVYLNYIELDNPELTAKVKFGILEQVSYISFADLSRFPITYLKSQRKKHKYDAYDNIETMHDAQANVIVPVEGQVDEYVVSVRQNDHYVDTTDGNITQNFDFKISGIEAVINEYEPFGAITLEAKEVSEIKDVMLNVSEYSMKSGNIIKEFVEYNVLIQDESNSVLMPILPMDRSGSMFEYVLPLSIAENNVAKYRTRFQVVIGSDIHVVNLHTGSSTLVAVQDITVDGNGYATVNIHDYSNQYTYAIEYSVSNYTADDIISTDPASGGWIVSSNMYMKYYRDMNGNNKLAIRNKNGNTLNPFSGNITGHIEMMSLEVPYMSPMVYNYELLCD